MTIGPPRRAHAQVHAYGAHLHTCALTISWHTNRIAYWSVKTGVNVPTVMRNKTLEHVDSHFIERQYDITGGENIICFVVKAFIHSLWTLDTFGENGPIIVSTAKTEIQQQFTQSPRKNDYY
ncbi:hypothetical protein EG68_05467 [Paragonimus skrjabini miyazakii]|uniref:Uncharacterized protein n=1 Tax=Paragonimus skrjabini miyazakii TaxID=59628 RepID=A0A8S9YRM4_9TREM|nr:hypothetical protein EG68_05467 [Paragonimus skrjabini miyazakii]